MSGSIQNLHVEDADFRPTDRAVRIQESLIYYRSVDPKFRKCREQRLVPLAGAHKFDMLIWERRQSWIN